MNLSFEQVVGYVRNNNKTPYKTPHAPEGYSAPEVNPGIVVCIAWAESTFNPNVISTDGDARGLMQIRNSSRTLVNNNTPAGVHFEPTDLMDPAKNIQCGTYLLALKLQLGNPRGNLEQAIKDYRGGPTAGEYATKVMRCSDCINR